MQIVKRTSIFIAALLLASATPSFSQIFKSTDAAPAGTVIYSLPQTSVRVTVTVSLSKFTAGPYAAYSEKYLGTSADRSSKNSCTIEEVELTPLVEADQSLCVALNIGNSKNASANFLNFCTQGLIVAPGYFTAETAPARFPSPVQPSFSEGVANLTTQTTQLYKSVTNEDGEVEKVAVPQTQTVAKSLEKKAEETAQLIFRLREKKIDILTGDTDANYSGAALGSAVEKMTLLENEYTSLFTGKTTVAKQTASFEVVPKAKNAKQSYVVFRISDSQGLLPPDNMSGRPVYLELTVTDGKIAPEVSAEEIAASKGKVAYRMPLVVTARLLDGQTVIGQTRIPVYQFGRLAYFPLDLALGK
ncbi:MAG: DUF4831 family protein [Bacteroidales bacterium]|nr:DUF4831 family protein [Bacteroidales bacterium]